MVDPSSPELMSPKAEPADIVNSPSEAEAETCARDIVITHSLSAHALSQTTQVPRICQMSIGFRSRLWVKTAGTSQLPSTDNSPAEGAHHASIGENSQSLQALDLRIMLTP